VFPVRYKLYFCKLEEIIFLIKHNAIKMPVSGGITTILDLGTTQNELSA
jgi:hypothetical protein